MKHRCRDCHFLAREYPPGFPHHRDEMLLPGETLQNRRTSWTKEERETGQMKHEEIASPMCRQGIWDAGINQELTSKLEEIIDKNRKDDCFYIEYSEGMSFDGATELHRIRYEIRHLKKSYQMTWWGLIIAAFGLSIAAFGLLVNAVFQAVNFFFK